MDFFHNHQKCKLLLGRYEGCRYFPSSFPKTTKGCEIYNRIALVRVKRRPDPLQMRLPWPHTSHSAFKNAKHSLPASFKKESLLPSICVLIIFGMLSIVLNRMTSSMKGGLSILNDRYSRWFTATHLSCAFCFSARILPAPSVVKSSSTTSKLPARKNSNDATGSEMIEIRIDLIKKYVYF